MEAEYTVRPLIVMAAVAVFSCMYSAAVSAQERGGFAQAEVASGTVLTAECDVPFPLALVTLAALPIPTQSALSTSDDGSPPTTVAQRTGADCRYRFSGVAPGRYGFFSHT